MADAASLTGELIMPEQEIFPTGTASIVCAGCGRVVSDEVVYVRGDELWCQDCEGDSWE